MLDLQGVKGNQAAEEEAEVTERAISTDGRLYTGWAHQSAIFMEVREAHVVLNKQ